LILSALNSSRSAYASFTLDKSAFFEKYTYGLTSESEEEGRFTCQLYNKALLSVFKGRLGDRRDNDTAIERCEVSIPHESERSESRIIVKMTYRLTYESVKVEHALFNHNAANNRWRISANVLRSFLEYFGANTEQLAISAEDGRVAFTSYTEKIINGKEILKHPLETSIAIDTLDFEEFSVEEKILVAISVKDFRAIVLHAETLKTSVQAQYSFPTGPMQILYQEHGLQCEFTLATIGNHRGSSVTPAPISIRNSPAIPTEARPSRPASVQPIQITSNRALDDRSREAMPPPSQPASRSFPQAPSIQIVPGNFQRESLSQRSSRPSPPPPKASLDPESLFLPAGDDDQQWEETNYDDDEDVLGWDASANQASQDQLHTLPRLMP
ncbi:MAG: hypothetical protein Q9228_007432, partial [Teloschistes exilis]